MTEVRPTYYASGTYAYEFELIGSGFGVLPDDAIGVPMSHNDNPLENRNSTQVTHVMHIVERSANRIVVRAEQSSWHPAGSIGGLVSSDRRVVYWENDTNPIP